MQFTTAIVAAILAVSVSAAPAIQARDETWIIENMHRECTDASCTWTFGINNQIAPSVPCTYTIDSNGSGNPPFKHGGTTQTCAQYSLSSGWDGTGVGFTTWGLVDNDRQMRAYPSYNEDEVGNGQTVAQKPFTATPVTGQ